MLLAIGRRPNTDDLGLEAAGVETDRARLHHVDEQLRTNVAGIWALGDCNGRAPSPTPPTTTSRSSPPTCSTTTRAGVSDRIPAYALYIDPPLGRAGMTEAEARNRAGGCWSASGR